jgi:hypothetical protein
MAMENFRAAVGEKLLPKLIEASPALLKLTDMAIALAGAFAEAPELVAGGFLAANAMMGATEASFAALVESNGVLAGKNAAAGTTLASAMLVIGAGIAAYMLTTKRLEKVGKEDDVEYKTKLKEEAARADELIGKVNDGTASPQDVKDLKNIGLSAQGRAKRGFAGTFSAIFNEEMAKPDKGIFDIPQLIGSSLRKATNAPNEAADARLMSDAVQLALGQKGGVKTSSSAQLEAEKRDAAAELLKGEIKVRVVNPEKIGGGDEGRGGMPILGTGMRFF